VAGEETLGWEDAFAALSASERDSRLDAEGLERLATAAYMTGRDDACERAWTAAHREWLRRGEPARAARCAFRQALGLFFRGELAPATGWVARGGRILSEAGQECVERAWLLLLTALPQVLRGGAASVEAQLTEAEAVVGRFADADASALARLVRGVALIEQGEVAGGVASLDEAMVAVAADEVSPLVAGIAYCQVIALCERVLDVRRAREWTEALARWCAAQPGLVPFRGNCLVHRCEILRLQGAWPQALVEAQQACASLAGPPAWDSLGSAFYQLAEIQRLRGELAEAEESYRRAAAAGRDPEPGLSLLRLAQGRPDLALAATRRLLRESRNAAARARILPAFVESALAAGDAEAAREAAGELAAVADVLDAPYVRALAAHASGAVLLAEGDAAGALPELRRALAGWAELEAPYESARVRVLLGLACRALGDGSGAEIELQAARLVFEQLGAAPDLVRLRELAPARRSDGLSPREAEVLALVAAGKANRAIAAELFISEKTVARHLSNIFAKLQLSSRTEAAAFAYKHGLAR